jgi:lipopolysaccharide export system permease protein
LWASRRESRSWLGPQAREGGVFLSILQRMILFELGRVFFLALAGITGILVLAGIVAEASQQGLSLLQVVFLVPLLVPNTLPYTIPTTTLFATCIVYGRLAHDNEALAIKAAGINLLHAVVPCLVLGVAMSCVTLGLYYRLIPHTHHLLRSRVLNDVEEYLYTILRRERVLKQPGLNYAIWVRQVQGTRLIDATFKRTDARGQYDIVAHAREAELHVDMEKREISIHMRHCEVQGENSGGQGYFEDRVLALPMPQDLGANRRPRPRALDWPELRERRRELECEVQELAVTIAAESARMLLAGAPLDLPKHVDNLRMRLKYKYLEIHGVDTEMHMRPALAFGCLFFALIGCPVGMWFGRSDYLSSFMSCFLPIVLIYYPLLLCGTNLARDGRLMVPLALWMPNAVLFLATPFLFRQLLRH